MQQKHQNRLSSGGKGGAGSLNTRLGESRSLGSPRGRMGWGIDRRENASDWKQCWDPPEPGCTCSVQAPMLRLLALSHLRSFTDPFLCSFFLFLQTELSQGGTSLFSHPAPLHHPAQCLPPRLMNVFILSFPPLASDSFTFFEDFVSLRARRAPKAFVARTGTS